MEPLRGKGDRGRELGPWNESLKGVGTLVLVLYFPINTKGRGLLSHMVSPGHKEPPQTQSNRIK